MKVKVSVDEKLCIGSGTCIVIDSENFELNDEGKAEVKASEKAKTKGMELLIDVDEKKKKQLIEAAMACPAQAIRIVDENGKKIY